MIDPSAYDPDDLRSLAGVAPEEPPSETPTPSADDRFHAAHLRALVHTARALPPEARTRPYLPRIPPAPQAEELVADWLDFLVRRVGVGGAADALDYYRRLGWLSDDAAGAIRAHLSGVPDRERGGALDADDHRLSLLYVCRLAAVGVDTETDRR